MIQNKLDNLKSHLSQVGRYNEVFLKISTNGDVSVINVDVQNETGISFWTNSQKTFYTHLMSIKSC